MKKVLLIGDSIRMGYDDYVKESLKNLADVYYPQQNCQSSHVVLRNLHYWADSLELYDADAVHFNAGHWDTVRIYGDEPLTPIKLYGDYIKRIAKRISFLFPKAKIIFATSTPVLEEGFIADFEMRRNSDVEAYNAQAVEALSGLDVEINDLYALMKDKPKHFFSDHAHLYTADATELLGKQVANTLCKALGEDPRRLSYPDPQRYHRPKAYPMDIDAYEKKGHIYVEKRS